MGYRLRPRTHESCVCSMFLEKKKELEKLEKKLASVKPGIEQAELRSLEAEHILAQRLMRKEETQSQLFEVSTRVISQ